MKRAVDRPARAIILSTQRTGSTFLVECLASHPDIHSITELLVGAHLEPPALVRSSRNLTKAARFLMAGGWHPTRAIRKFYAAVEKPVGIFKVMYNQLAYPPTLASLTRDTDIRVLHLSRRNLLKMHVSQLLMPRKRNAIWEPHTTEPLPPVTVRVDPAAAIDPFDARFNRRVQGAYMRIIVTGATGFIGINFVDLAISRGHRVGALHRPALPANGLQLASLQSRGIETHAGDVRDRESLRAAMKGAHCVVHFAAAFRESGVPDDYFLTVNVTGTRNAVEVAAEEGASRFVFCSTAGIYGSTVPGVANESTATSPQNVYERSKVAAEAVVREVSAARGIQYAILRPAVVYGPRDRRLIKMFRAAARGRFPQFGPGNGRRHMVFVADVARAALRACVTPGAAGQEMIVAGPRAAPLREILSTLARALDRRSCGPKLPLWPMLALAAMTEDACGLLGVKPPIYRRRMDFYRNDAGFDCSRAFDVLGWRPAVDLDEGFGRTIASYRSEGLM